jgi:hypothetical protein
MADWLEGVLPTQAQYADLDPYSHPYQPIKYGGPKFGKEYHTPNVIENPMLFASSQYQPKVRKSWMTETGFSAWGAKQKNNPYKLKRGADGALVDIDGDKVPDVVVVDEQGRTVAVNGVMLNKSKLPSYFAEGNLLEARAKARNTWTSTYKASIADLKKQFRKVVVKDLYEEVLAESFNEAQRGIIKRYVPASLVSNKILEHEIMNYLDSQMAGVPNPSPQLLAKRHGTKL